MRGQAYYQYYVEGEDEVAVLNALKMELRCIRAGRIEKFNSVQNVFTSARIRTLRPNTSVILVYDTDTNQAGILEENILFLNKHSFIKEVICIPQVKNLEDEILRSCQIKNAAQLTGSDSRKDFKRDLISCTNLGAKLKKCGFDISKFWNSVPENEFYQFGNQACKIKC